LTKTWNIERAANDHIHTKHLDNGTMSAPEQPIIADKDIYDPLVKELERHKAYVVDAEEKAKLDQYMVGCTAHSGQTPKVHSARPGQVPALNSQGRRHRDSGRRHHPRR
jgi:hypothetical protein